MRMLLAALLGLLAGVIIGYECEGFRPPAEPTVLTRIRNDTIVIRDTVVKPVPVRTRPEVRFDTVELLTIERDTVTVTVPMEQKVYSGDGYRAVISGYRPGLDTILIDRKQITRTVTRAPPRWSVGLQGGIGVTPKGIQPYVGVGATYNIRL